SGLPSRCSAPMPGGRLGGRETLSGSPARDAVRPRPVGRTPTAEPALRSSVKAAFGRMAGERRSGPPAAGREDEGGEEAECEAGDVPGVAHGGRRERGGRDVEQREEIGRASWRERGEATGGAAAVGSDERSKGDSA